ncbi:hemerythrin domain-containing protein [Candidatus Accumulibacter sp. ACC003]|uniref:hemerythrin domain-containing protein n=1 Tax=Candidatus Accumulibacter sp. ACC003 TaxID=2823334 RepID=UPI0025C091D8|nr:hemerythrin domain-containing protein [Candidatus Accumulibacter sp. ACC003]
MHGIRDFMANDHRACDRLLATVEQSVVKGAWELAEADFGRFRDALLSHFGAEESVLFPLFEECTGMRLGPTQVMRDEHAQMRQLLTAAEAALAENDADEYDGNSETLLIMIQQHNIKEENVLYPMCDQRLAAQLETLLPRLQELIVDHERAPR